VNIEIAQVNRRHNIIGYLGLGWDLCTEQNNLLEVIFFNQLGLEWMLNNTKGKCHPRGEAGERVLIKRDFKWCGKKSDKKNSNGKIEEKRTRDYSAGDLVKTSKSLIWAICNNIDQS